MEPPGRNNVADASAMRRDPKIGFLHADIANASSVHRRCGIVWGSHIPRPCKRGPQTEKDDEEEE